MATLLLTGATGKAGGFALAHMVAHPEVSHIISLQRRPLPDDVPAKKSPKLEELIVPTEAQWTDYPEEILSQLKDVTGCVWDLGSTKFPDMETTHRVSTDYTLHALSALQKTRATANDSGQRPIRFVYLSGALTERDQTARLTLLADYRKARGRTENQLLEAASKIETAASNDNNVDNDNLVAIVRSSMIADANAGAPAKMVSKLTGLLYDTVTAQELAAGMVDLALHGRRGRSIGTDGNAIGRIVENAEIQRLGREVLKKA